VSARTIIVIIASSRKQWSTGARHKANYPLSAKTPPRITPMGKRVYHQKFIPSNRACKYGSKSQSRVGKDQKLVELLNRTHSIRHEYNGVSTPTNPLLESDIEDTNQLAMFHPFGNTKAVPNHNRASKKTQNWLRYLIGPILFVTTRMALKRRQFYRWHWHHQHQLLSNNPSFIESCITRALQITIEGQKRPSIR